ncbi:MAG TPA: DUF1259 domain-containing protein, partial [Candidatus Babeliaceae bacterium]|nr:DUF1259 domain-containing protein [Candidatus Babeliaceae bacterium]
YTIGIDLDIPQQQERFSVKQYEDLERDEAQEEQDADQELQHHYKQNKPMVKDNTCQHFASILGGVRILKGVVPDSVCVVAKPRTKVPITIKGIETHSPLVNTALFSFEQGHDGKYLNLGETGALLKEIPPFREALEKQNIGVTAIHTHWLENKPEGLMYIHWMSVEDPFEFAQKTAKAWQKALA